ncbi:MAG: phenylalanine--tRNA ligase subunit beta [Elusimicrobia bacterium]|nr:phenylalanine--tRNA ligase subunit beta [Elusimicrobiota bacterium]
MKYFLSWVQEFLPGPLPDVDHVVAALEQLGLSVAGLERTQTAFEGVVTAQVENVGNHPNAERLRLATVFDGSHRHQVVCGAVNLAKGQCVALAKIGARLPGEDGKSFVIETRKIRGIESCGMICSARELGLGQDAQGIMVLPQDWVLGRPMQSYIAPDAVIDLELPSNRWDLMSHLGLSRELAIYFWRASSKDHQLSNPVETRQKISISIAENALSACARYEGALLSGIKVGPSSWTVSHRLRALGYPTINNVVDATNYVMLELGQPLHAFDWAKIKGETIQVRWAQTGERLAALNGRSYELGPQDLVIADAERPVALAGIIGGEETKVVETTTDVLIECAWFARSHVRRRSKALGLSTESSQRFERETDVVLLGLAVNRTLEILKETPGVSVRATTSVFPNPPLPVRFELSPDLVSKTLGFSVSNEELFSLLTPLCEETEKFDSGRWLVTPKSWRSDLRLNEDIAEEALRYLGFEKISKHQDDSARIPAITNIPDELQWLEGEQGRSFKELTKARYYGDRLVELFLGDGFDEALNHSMVSGGQIEEICGPQWLANAVQLENPVSADMAFVRPSLSLGLYQNWLRNRRYGKGGTPMFLQELGYVHSWDSSWPSQAPMPGSALHWAAAAWGPFWPLHWKRQEENNFDFWQMTGTLEQSLRRIGAFVSRRKPANPMASWHPHFQIEFCCQGVDIGYVAQIATEESLDHRWDSPLIVAEVNLDRLESLLRGRASVRYAPVPGAELIRRDLSVIIEKSISWGKILKCVQKELGDLLEMAAPLDVYVAPKLGHSKKSVAFRVWLRPPNDAVRVDEINEWLARAGRRLKMDIAAEVRHG